MTAHASSITQSDAARLDAQDPLAHCRERFSLPPEVIYLDGNSLGAMPKAVPARMQQALEQEWAVGLIRSWNQADWYRAPQRVGARAHCAACRRTGRRGHRLRFDLGQSVQSPGVGAAPAA